MRLLIISSFYPMPDRLAGDHRFMRFIEGLVDEHQLDYVAYAPDSQAQQFGLEETERYRQGVADAGIQVLSPGVRPALRRERYDAIFFQYYYQLPLWITDVRAFQPWARVVVDNGDVAFRRFFSKAELTGKAEDFAEAEVVKREELAAYRQADAVLTVSKEDTDVVAAEIRDLRAYIIPNIHTMPPPRDCARDRHMLVFVGSFIHHPNTDGILYFVQEVMPIIRHAYLGVRLQIVGNAPTEEVLALTGEDVEVLGYVPETAPYLDSAYISIAPLRFGAGVKGKIGEAMAHRLPVVTTSIGIDGFGLTPGENVLVADTPELFARHVLDLLRDERLHERLAEAGFRFVQAHFSEAAVILRIREFMKELPSIPVKQLSLRRRLTILAGDWIDRQIGWRLKARKTKPTYSNTPQDS